MSHRTSELPGVVAILVVLTTASTACVHTESVERKVDADRPVEDRTKLVYDDLFAQSQISNTVIAGSMDGDKLDRVLLSPNLVFESSRSSLKEPKTYGPKKKKAGAPNIKHAMGRPVKISLSTALIEFLTNQGSTVVTPVISRTWGQYMWCNDEASWCNPGTWVERVMMFYQQARKDQNQAPSPPRRMSSDASSDGQDSARRRIPSGGIDASSAPTAAFAVRTLGLEWISRPVRVTETEGGGYEVAFTSTSGEGKCPNLSLQLPYIMFEAELVSLEDGKLLMRIDEMRTLDAPRDTELRFNPFNYRKTKATEYMEYQVNMSGERIRPIYDTEYKYVSSWEPTGFACDRVAEELNEVTGEMAKKSSSDEIARKLMRNTLQQLYRR